MVTPSRMSTDASTPPSPKVILRSGLHNQDDNLDELVALYEEFQVASVEASNPAEDFLTFASRCFHFAAICKPEEGLVKYEDTETRRGRAPPVQFSESYEPNTYQTRNQWGSTRATSWNQARFGSNAQIYSGWRQDWRGASSCKQESSNEILPTFDDCGRFDSSPSTSADRSTDTYWPHHTATDSQFVPNHQSPQSTPDKLIGMIYLIESQPPSVPGTVGEMSIGIILHSNYRGLGYAKAAVQKMLNFAFDELKVHRVQALLTDTYYKDRALNLFTQLCFGHEGTRRRSFFSHLEQEYKDITCLAILDTDWVMRSYFTAAPKSLWDEMLLRHERERDELLRWDTERKRTLHRTDSVETIRDGGATTTESDSAISDAESSSGSEDGVSNISQYVHYGSDADDSDVDGDDHLRMKFRKIGTDNAGPSTSQRDGSPQSSEDGYESAATSVPSTSSEWDVVDEWSDSGSAFSPVDGDDL
ncbi:spermidine n1-acetyltransferase [Moniliophthora roreri MCA 2997]|uniref:Spermidine n1-acetyltransferase n=1 Tax=Moniliophthora roreri (strain MCA 2997) TaxID=1381753 RepID=V2XAY4_MONRO|nr:spermidine n1-acetyltransferase [Moniliophthora roreri MCA 2997]